MTAAKAAQLGAEGPEGAGAVLRFRDLPMRPTRGIFRTVHWMQFEATLQLRIPLRGAEWNGVQPEMFHVKASATELIAKCRTFYVMEELHLRFQHEVDPERCWYRLEGEVRQPSSRCKVLLVEVAKRNPGETWGPRVLAGIHPPQPPSVLQCLFEVDSPGWASLPLCSRRDEEDERTTSREALCSELLTGQDELHVHIRVVFNPGPWREVAERVPYYHVWGLDVSRRYMRLFLRGDHARPVLSGRLKGNCTPDRCWLQLSSVPGPTEEAAEGAPCLDIFIAKADDSFFDWGMEPIDCKADVGVLDREAPGCTGDLSSLDLAGRSPAQWIEDLRARAAAAFKAGEFPNAIELYTRLLQCTPGSEKLLTNRSIAYLKVGKSQLALDDALKAQEIRPDFPKVYFRKGQALQALNRLKEAIAAFTEGGKLDNDNAEWSREILKVRHVQKSIKQKKGQWI